MNKALVIGASGGIGAAMMREMRARGGDVTPLSRSENGFDVTDPDGVARALGVLSGPFQSVFVASGILAPAGQSPEKRLAAIDAGAMAEVLAVNTIGTANILAHLPKLLPREGRSVVGVLTARVGSIGDNALGGWHSYRASKAAANMLVRGAAVELRRTHPDAIVAALHPGTVDTPFTQGYQPAHGKLSPEEAARRLCDVMAGLKQTETGGFFDHTGQPVPW